MRVVSVAARPAFAAVRNQLAAVPQFRAVPRLQGEYSAPYSSRPVSTHRLSLTSPPGAVRGYAAESGKFSRSLPHMNVGTIGHVDHGKSPAARRPPGPSQPDIKQVADVSHHPRTAVLTRRLLHNVQERRRSRLRLPSAWLRRPEREPSSTTTCDSPSLARVSIKGS